MKPSVAMCMEKFTATMIKLSFARFFRSLRVNFLSLKTYCGLYFFSTRQCDYSIVFIVENFEMHHGIEIVIIVIITVSKKSFIISSIFSVIIDILIKHVFE